MEGNLFSAMMISASGMRTQSVRSRIITENIANSDTTGTKPGDDPYQRKTISFMNELDRASGVKIVKVDKVSETNGEFVLKYKPGHPAADEAGYVKYPNVNSLIEMADMRESQRSYEANLGMIETARSMLQRTIDILRA